MALQTINIGASANDGSGDPLRTAMDKINDNFELLDTVFNVKDPEFAGGADNTGATDALAAFDAAIAALNAAGGGKLVVPDGTYRLSATWDIVLEARYYAIELAPSAIIKAASGFAVDTKLILVQDDSPAVKGVRFGFHGGKLDGRLIPKRSSGAPDLLYITSKNIEKCEVCGTEFLVGNLITQSTTSIAIGTGSKAFTTADNLDNDNSTFIVGQAVHIVSRADTANGMYGTVTASSGTTLTVNVTSVDGAGTFTDWTIMPDGGDSGVFLAEGKNFTVERNDFRGFVDAAVYISGDATEAFGENASVHGNFFDYCDTAIISKRSFKRYVASNNFVKNGGTGIATGDADPLLPGTDIIISNNEFYRVARAINPRWADGAVITGNHIVDFGINRAQQTVAESGILIDGSIGTVVTANTISALGVTLPSGANAILLQARTIDSVTVNSTHNNVSHNIINIDTGTCIKEDDSSQGKNTFLFNRKLGSSTTVTKANTDSILIEENNSGDLQLTADNIYLGGTTTNATVNVARVASAVNRFKMEGSAASGASGTIFSNEGNDATIPISIVPKSTAPVLIGGGANAEALRVGKGVSSGNAVEIVGVAAGSAPEVKARGADTNPHLKLSGKGTGNVQLGANTFSMPHTITTPGTTGNQTINKAAGEGEYRRCRNNCHRYQ